MKCPVCAEEFDDSLFLELHVDAHFDVADDEYFEEKSTSLSSGEDGVNRERPVDSRAPSSTTFLADNPTEVFGAVHSSPKRDSVEDILLEAAAAMVGRPSWQPPRPSWRPQSNLIDDRRSSTIDPLSSLKARPGLYLCSPCDHFASSGQYRGFACGYRNIQIILSALLRQDDFKEIVFNGKDWMPPVPEIQKLIEDAWRNGFDHLGSLHFNGTLQKTRRWIGATEVASLLSSLSIRCRLMEFRTIGPFGYHQHMFDWLLDHFRNRAANNFLCPLYLQHEGHSRCIVGIDELQREILLFDPSCPPKLMRSRNPQALLAKLSHSVERFHEEQYQLVVIQGIMDNEREFEEAKVLENICDRIN